MSVPSTGATILFTTAPSIAASNLTIPISGTAGTASASATLSLQVKSDPLSGSYFNTPLFREVQLQPGGSATLQQQITPMGTELYQLSLDVSGLPTGVTATVSPQLVEGAMPFTVTLSASSSAPLARNVPITITGTPGANVTPPSVTYLLDVTPASGGAGWTNQTSYVPLRGTPYSGVYDPAHQFIYAANLEWNRVDIISDTTRLVVRSISIPDPRGMDLSIDGSTVWVATGSQLMYAINTGTFQITRYIIPRYVASSGSAAISWEGAQVFSLADGTLLLIFSDQTGSGSFYGAIWNPATNAFPTSSAPAAWGAVARSGDGKHVFSFGGDELMTSFTYDVLSKTYSDAVSLSSFGYAGYAVANGDGSRVAVSTAGAGFLLYDGTLNEIGPLPGDGGGASPGAPFPAMGLLFGGFVFSSDGQTLYEETEAYPIALIMSIDVATQQAKSFAPAMAFGGAPNTPTFELPAPFALDANGMLLGIEVNGIAFDDPTVNMNFSSLEGGTPDYMYHMSVYGGPLAGGTTSSQFGNAFSLLPDVYYGPTKGTAALSSGSLSITSPPASAAGTVDIKMLFPDGLQVFEPQFFTYGTHVDDAIINGGSPQGGAAAELDADGMSIDQSQDTVSIGGNNAPVTSSLGVSGPAGSTLNFTAPGGSPGWADIALTTPNGAATLPKSFLFAKSVTDYPTPDSPSFVLFDKARNQLYLSAGNHIDVFSLSSNSFTGTLQPPSVGANKQFEGLALTPDGKYLLAADLADYSVAEINPDNPSGAFAVPVATGGKDVGYSCPTGPLFVAADNLGNAYVVTGGVIGTACGPGGYEAIVNLSSKTSTLMNAKGCDIWGQAAYVRSNADGTIIAFGPTGNSTGTFQLYIPAHNSCIPAPALQGGFGVPVSGDGNVIGAAGNFVDPLGDVTGRVAVPTVFYPVVPFIYSGHCPCTGTTLQNPALNDAGSLYYWIHPNSIDIIDVQHGLSTLRFGLAENVENVVAPMAIDSSGQQIFLITDKGLTIADLGNAPLSIGHLSQATAAAGSAITIRGSGFESGITAKLGDAPASVSFTDSETLLMTIPAVNSGPQDLTLSNPDGKSYTLQSAISVQ